MSEFRQYQRRATVAEMRPYVPGETLDGVSVLPEDEVDEGGMVARNPENHADQWYVAPTYFARHFEPEALDPDTVPVEDEDWPAVVNELIESYETCGPATPRGEVAIARARQALRRHGFDVVFGA